jgi:thiamine-phosphate pyrophosphorylase
MPWFAIGGIDTENVDEVVSMGAERICVVRAIRDAVDPRLAATTLFGAVDPAAREERG